MAISYTKKPEMIELFFEFINERHLIYLKRQRGDKWPWTNDKALREYKFTNIFRELDAGTVWYREHIREPFADHPLLFFNTVVYRAFNLVETGEFLGFLVHPDDYVDEEIDHYKPNKIRPWHPDKIEALLRRRHEGGTKVFTSAHMLTGTLGGDERKDKVWQVVQAVCNHMWEHMDDYIPQPGDTLQQAFERLTNAPGHGPFIAYEVITDLRHTRYLKDASDVMTWANPGPGAMRGINRICGLGVGVENELTGKKYPVKRPGLDYIEKMQQLLHISKKKYNGERLKAMWVPDMEMRDIEHALCEFDKYMRVVTGEGRPRQKFVPPHER